jgi:predicted dehydrogenase
LTDPVLNGGGALNDFGCYGADLITWLLDGQKPTSVFAVTQQFKPEIYPKVEDEATIVLVYPQTQGIIEILDAARESARTGKRVALP